MQGLSQIIEAGEAERLATGFTFTEGPLYHPDGFYYFVDVRESKFYRIRPGSAAELLRENTGEGNGTTFDPQGRLIICEGGNRRLTRWPADGRFASSEVLVDRFEGKRLSRPNDVDLQVGRQHLFHQPRTADPTGRAGARSVGGLSGQARRRGQPCRRCRIPERARLLAGRADPLHRQYRHAMYIHAIELDGAGNMVRRRIFADMSSDEKIGVPDGMKVDVEGRVYCTGPGGTWVFAPDGAKLGIIRTPEVPANLCFGGPDMKTLFFTAHTSVYSLRVKVPGLPGHPFKR